jgi:5'-nucleotidase
MTFIDNLKKENRSILQLDSGDLFIKYGHSSESKDVKRNAEIISRAYRAMGVDAVNVGDLDLWMGIPFLREEAKKGFPLTSANILFKTDRRPIFSPYIIKELNGVRFGIFGLIQNTSPPLRIEVLDNIFVSDPIVVAKSMVQELKSKSDIIILLSDLGKRIDQILATEVPRINFILGGHDGEMIPDPIKVGDTWIFQHYHKGMYMGQIDLNIEDRNYKFQEAGIVERLNKELEMVKRQLQFMKGRENNPSFQSHIIGLKNQKEDLEKRLKEAKTKPVKGTSFHHKIIELHKGIADHSGWKEILQAIEKEAKQER